MGIQNILFRRRTVILLLIIPLIALIHVTVQGSLMSRQHFPIKELRIETIIPEEMEIWMENLPNDPYEIEKLVDQGYEYKIGKSHPQIEMKIIFKYRVYEINKKPWKIIEIQIPEEMKNEELITNTMKEKGNRVKFKGERYEITFKGNCQAKARIMHYILRKKEVEHEIKRETSHIWVTYEGRNNNRNRIFRILFENEENYHWKINSENAMKSDTWGILENERNVLGFFKGFPGDFIARGRYHREKIAWYYATYICMYFIILMGTSILETNWRNEKENFKKQIKKLIKAKFFGIIILTVVIIEIMGACESGISDFKIEMNGKQIEEGQIVKINENYYSKIVDVEMTKKGVNFEASVYAWSAWRGSITYRHVASFSDGKGKMKRRYSWKIDGLGEEERNQIIKCRIHITIFYARVKIPTKFFFLYIYPKDKIHRIF